MNLNADVFEFSSETSTMNRIKNKFNQRVNEVSMSQTIDQRNKTAVDGMPL